jgi:hypothetical protein
MAIFDKLQSMSGNFVSRLGGANVLSPEQEQQLTALELQAYNQQKQDAKTAGMRELSARLSDAFGGRDIGARSAIRKETQEMTQRETQLNKAIDESNLSEDQKRIIKPLSLDDKSKIIYQLQTQTAAAIPADIQKLERFGLLKTKLDENSPNYDPSYTADRLNQDASILGVNAQLLDQTKNQYISDYMKEKGKLKSLTGQMTYSNKELRDMAEESYNLVYGNDTTPPNNAVDDTGEEIVDLGSL